MKHSLFACVLLAAASACGGSSSGTSPDAPHGTGDAPGGTVDGPGSTIDAFKGTVPATIKISGSTGAASSATAITPVPNIAVAVFKASDDSMVTSGSSDGSGNFTLDVTTGGVPFDGYLKASGGSTYMDTYLFAPKPLTADFDGATVEMLQSSTLSGAAFISGVTLDTNDGFIGIEIDDDTGAPITGAKITASGGTVKYLSGGIPSSSATVTDSSGTGFIFNVPPGSVTVSASKAGQTFTSHAVKAVKGEATETVVEP